MPGLVVLTVLTGLMMLAAGLLRGGGLTRFISHAVMVGFMTGVAVQIVLGQLGALTGFSSGYDNKVAEGRRPRRCTPAASTRPRSPSAS